MEKKIKDLTVSEFQSLVKRIVRKVLQDYDPDDTLMVKDNIVKLLNRSGKQRKAGKQKTVPFDKVFAKTN